MSNNYWQKRGEEFAKFYSPKKLSVRSFVSLFLDSRTDSLLKLSSVDTSDTVLDLGCGSGVHMKILAPNCRKIIGVDISKDMVTLAKKETKGFKNAFVYLADCDKLPFDNREFDVVIAMGLMDYVSNWTNTLREISRVMKKNGTVIFTIPKKPSLFAFLRSSWGNNIKKKIFGLPPVYNIVNYENLKSGLMGFKIISLRSVWTTMWIVKAQKI